MMFDSDFARHVPPRLHAAMTRLRDPEAVWEIFRNDETVADMKRLTAQKRPAVGATSAKLLALGDWVREPDAKKTFGKLARFMMEVVGGVVDMRGVETPEDPLFTKGTRYRLPAPSRVEGVTDLAPDDASPLDLQAPLLDRLVRVLSVSELEHLADKTRNELERR
jgi:hypothetical protein